MPFESPAACLASTATEYGSSRYGEWFRCNRSHDLRYRLKLQRAPHRGDIECLAAGEEPEGSDDELPFQVGSIVHAGINWITEGVMLNGPGRHWDQVIGAAHEFKDQDRPQGFSLGSIYEAERLLAAYFAFYGYENAGWDDRYEIVACELQLSELRQFAIPFTGAADCVLRTPSGEILIPDHKTRAKSLPKDEGSRATYARGLSTRIQFAGLSWMVREHFKLDYNPAVLVNGIIKTRIPAFQRLRVDFTDQTIDFWKKAIADAALTGLRPNAMNPTSCAPEIGKRCWAFDYCHGSEEIRQKRFVLKGDCNDE